MIPCYKKMSFLPKTAHSESIQNRYAYGLYKLGLIAGSFFIDDIPTLSTCVRILRGNPFIEANAKGQYLTEENAARLLQLTFIMATIVWQIKIANFSAYYLTTFSGLEKIFHAIFLNPIYGIFFLVFFNARALAETDTSVLAVVNKSLGLAPDTHVQGTRFREALVSSLLPQLTTTIPVGVKGFYAISYLMDQAAQAAPALLLDHVVVPVASKISEIMKTERSINLVLATVDSDELQTIGRMKNAATYLPRTVEIDYYDEESINRFLGRDEASIVSQIKSDGYRRKTGADRKKFEEELHSRMRARDASGNAICLDQCKDRVKTKKGCYCEGPCSTTTIVGLDGKRFGGQPWCYVDPAKCKGSKKGAPLSQTIRPSISGIPDWKPEMSLYKSFDYCDPKNTKRKCWDGYKYSKCNENSD
jgi:hypothetical protein